MEKMIISLEPYADLVRKLHKINGAMQYAMFEISEEPLKKLCEDPVYRALAIQVFGEAQFIALDNIGEKTTRAESLRRWSKNVEKMQDNILVIDTCMGDLRIIQDLHFVYAVEGDSIITTEGGDILLREGQTAIFDIGVPHGVKSPEGSDSIIISVVMCKPYLTEMVGVKSHASPLFNEFLSKAFYPGDNYRQYIIIDTEKDNMIRWRFLMALWEYTYNGPFSQDAVDTNLMQVMISLLREYPLYFGDGIGNGRGPLNERTKRILDFIDANLCDVTLDSVAKAFHFSPNHLSRILKEQTGSTFMELVQKARLREATYYLRMKDLTVTQVANMVGYNNITYFYKLFQSKFNVSPNEYRKAFGLFSEKYRTKLFQDEEPVPEKNEEHTP